MLHRYELSAIASGIASNTCFRTSNTTIMQDGLGSPIANSSMVFCGVSTPGAPWRDIPSRYGPWQTVYDRFRRWRLDGTWMRILTYLLDHLDKHGRLGRDLWCVDASIIRATRAAGGAEKNPDPEALVVGAKNQAIC